MRRRMTQNLHRGHICYEFRAPLEYTKETGRFFVFALENAYIEHHEAFSPNFAFQGVSDPLLRYFSRGGRGGGLIGATGKRPAGRGRGAAARARLRPSARVQSGNDVTDNASSSTQAGAPAHLALPARTPRDNTSSGGQNEANENANLNGRLNNRNNRLASKKKMFSIFNSYPSLD